MEPPQNLENEQFSKLSSDSSVFHFYFLTLFPDALKPVLGMSLLGKAQKKGLVQYHWVQLRDFAEDIHRKVDDTPYGGGEGMLLKADVLYRAWASVAEPLSTLGVSPLTILLSPQGQVFDQPMARELTTQKHLILVCGHYEGVDERFIQLCVDREISIGDYVLTGGELPALVLAEAITRLLPGVVGNAQSLTRESLENGLLKHPQFTRPREFMGLSVPQVLLEGNHAAIEQWALEQSQERTRRKRPDLIWSNGERIQGG